MADERRRRLEREAAGGDAEAQAHLIAARLRGGELDRARVEMAAHLKDPLAIQMSSSELPGLKCLCGGLRACMHCAGTGTRPLPTDLVPFVRSAQVPADILREWACDCVEHVIPLVAEEEREPLCAMIVIARALAPELARRANRQLGLRGNVLRREPTPEDRRVSQTVQLLINAADLQRRLEPPERWRTAFAGAVTLAYRSAGNTRAERGWQIQALSRRLLG